jgi:hypothetical protein
MSGVCAHHERNDYVAVPRRTSTNEHPDDGVEFSEAALAQYLVK